MKKSLLVLSALLALSMAFVGCKGGASDPDISDPSGDVVKPAFTISYTGINGEAYFDVQDDWKSLEIEFVELDDAMQIAVKSKEAKAEHKDWTEYYAYYFAPENVKVTFVMDEVLATLKAECGEDNVTLATIGIQDNADAAKTFKVKSAKVTKTDDSVVDVKPRADGWNSSIN